MAGFSEKISVPGIGRIPLRNFFNLYARGSGLQTLFYTLRDHVLHPFVIGGKTDLEDRTISRIEIVFAKRVFHRFDGSEGLFRFMEEKKLNPNLLEKIFRLVDNSVIELWNRERSEAYRIDLSAVLRLQKEHISLGRSGRQDPAVVEAEKRRAEVYVSELTLKQLIDAGAVLAHLFTVDDIIALDVRQRETNPLLRRPAVEAWRQLSLFGLEKPRKPGSSL